MSAEVQDVDLVGEEVVPNVARAALFAALMGAFAFVSFPYPFSPAPVTLQVLAVFLAGIMLGAVWGGASMVLYLLAGALGAPVFAGGTAGLPQLFGAQGGYLFAFPLAAFAVGFVVHGGFAIRDFETVGVPRLVGGMVAGTVVVYVLGVVGLYLVLGSPQFTLWDAVVSGALVFLPAEALKMAAALGIVRSDAIAAG